MILVTGAEGLIGRYISTKLEANGLEVRRFDLRRSATEDTRDKDAMREALKDVRGVVHLAAVSRVIWGERNPALCESTNVTALANLVELCKLSQANPWLIFASSREVYGQASQFPVPEDAMLQPMNTYARSKRDGELIMAQARQDGLLANICRFSSVYGCPQDHEDRVVPAFAIAAARGGKIHVEGSGNLFDFTIVDEAVDGLYRLIQATMAGEHLPPIHFVSGKGTSLSEVARLAIAHALAPVVVEEMPPRRFDVSSFVGDPARAEELLGWKAHSDLKETLPRFINQLAAGALTS